MSYNIDSIDIIASDGFTIAPDALAKLHESLDGEHPEGWEPTGKHGVIMSIAANRFPWRGECSGSMYDVLVGKVLVAFDGSADLVVCWEGGNSYTGLRVSDHKVTEHEVEFRLGAQKD